MPTTYLAPGVYVEEVPSTQQVIAGVGTNTVGFIGAVPNDIQYPMPNEDYDPHLADLNARLSLIPEKTAEEQKLANQLAERTQGFSRKRCPWTPILPNFKQTSTA